MAEMIFETVLAALEATPGTAEANPTHYLIFNQGEGVMEEALEYARDNIADGTRAEFRRSKVSRRTTTTSGGGPLDLNNATFDLSLAVGNPVTTSPNATAGSITRLHTFTPSMTSDNRRRATVWWGDPNTQVFRSTHNVLNNWEVTFDPDSTDFSPRTMALTGQAMEPVADPVLPTRLTPQYVLGMDMELWIDTGASAIGTTAITGRVVSAMCRTPRNTSYKYLAKGPASNLSFTRTGLAKDHAEIEIVFEFLDMAQYNLFRNNTEAKIRLRAYGDLIETGFHHFFQMDLYGPMQAMAWDTYADTNRTLRLTAMSHNNADAQTAGHDWRVAIQNGRTGV